MGKDELLGTVLRGSRHRKCCTLMAILRYKDTSRLSIYRVQSRLWNWTNSNTHITVIHTSFKRALDLVFDNIQSADTFINDTDARQNRRF